MEVETSRSHRLPTSTREESLGSSSSPSPSIEYEFDESQCLFCNQMSRDVDMNLVHMSKTHGLHVDQTNLLVDVGSLLAYFHLIISGYSECLFCGTQRHSREAIQQHMMAKSHCKYDATDKNSELGGFYDFPISGAQDALRQNLPSTPIFHSHPQSPHSRSKTSRRSKSLDEHSPHTSDSPLDQTLPSPTPASQPHNRAEPLPNTDEPSSHSHRELSTRAQKQESTLNTQLAQLRAGDRRSILHLPTSQQRALLATHHKQMEKARRTEQIHQSNLEAAGNKTNCLDKIRLVRKPPHTGNVYSLNR